MISKKTFKQRFPVNNQRKIAETDYLAPVAVSRACNEEEQMANLIFEHDSLCVVVKLHGFEKLKAFATVQQKPLFPVLKNGRHA